MYSILFIITIPYVRKVYFYLFCTTTGFDKSCAIIRLIYGYKPLHIQNTDIHIYIYIYTLSLFCDESLRQLRLQLFSIGIEPVFNSK